MGIFHRSSSKSPAVISVTVVGRWPGTVRGLKSVWSVFLFFCSPVGDLNVRGYLGAMAWPMSDLHHVWRPCQPL